MKTMKKIIAIKLIAALLAGQVALASTDERWSQRKAISDDTVNMVIDMIIFVGGGRVVWEVWWRFVDKTPRP